MNNRAPSSTSGSSAGARGVALALVAMVAALIAIDVGGGALLRYAYARSTANPVHRPLVQGATTLALGSSTAKRAFDPSALWPSSYNAAEDGQGIFFAAAYMRNFPRESSVRRVVLGIDPDEIVSGYRSNNTPHLKRLSPLATGDAKLREQLRRTDPLLEIKYWSGLYPFRGDAAGILIEWIAPRARGAGYAPLNRSMAAADPWQARNMPPDTPSPEGLDALRDIVAAARARNIHLIAAVTPIVGGYRREREPRLAAAMEAVRRILAEGKACDLTAVDDPEIDAIARDASLFHDGPHLNGTGARRYTGVIKRLAEQRCPFVLD